MRTILRRALASLFTLFPARLSGASVLLYHSIALPDDGFLTDTPDRFGRHLAFIRARGFRTVFASELPAFLASGAVGNTVCITLDDGYRDNYQNAFPLLKEYGVKASVFLITGLVGKTYTDSRGTTRAMLSEEQIREMAASGLVEFLPHSHTHPDLPALDDAALDTEIARSKTETERLTGKTPRVFAYPKGKYDARVIAALARNGFTAAFSVIPGIARAGADPFCLPRNPLGRVSQAELELKLSDRLDAYLQLKNML